MSKPILKTKDYAFYKDESDLRLHFLSLDDQPFYVFEPMEYYQYEADGDTYVEKLASDILKDPVLYDQRLRYPLNQVIKGPREAFYLDRSYYCQNHNRKPTSVKEAVQYGIGMYSEGKSAKGIATYLTAVLKDQDVQGIDLNIRAHYMLTSSLVCLIHLLDMKELLAMKGLSKLVNRDRLLNLFYYQRKEPNMDLPIIHQDPYLFLSMELSTQEDHIEQFCINYYQAMKKVPWYDSHRFRFSDFFGYWSFELAYMVRFYGVSDMDFIDHMYYPRDLALRKFLPTWKDSQEGERARIYKNQVKAESKESSQAIINEILSLLNETFEEHIAHLMTADLFRRTMLKISESHLLFAKIGNDPSEKDMVKVRNFIQDMIHILGSYTDEISENDYLKDVENEMKAHMRAFIERKKYEKKDIETAMSLYFKSKKFEQQKLLNKNRIVSLVEELNKAQKIKDSEKYWKEMEAVFEAYGLMDEKAQESTTSLSREKRKKPAKDVSFRISFNDYL